MRQTLIILLVLAIVGAALVDASKADFQRRGMEQSKKIRGGMERVKSFGNTWRVDDEAERGRRAIGNGWRVQEEARRGRRAGMKNLREKVNELQSPNSAKEMFKLRTKKAAGKAKLSRRPVGPN
ncbi:uncharacterized protein LOC115921421 [Strongylocentrotus purpuratus]|uniref:Uncharacterized protein n=1 Tax=Strongylocentrotus purpuratus TaxID=7668 RepID=A0A7M7NFE8_STRPU|nr:uncharacterized protein LOC115921421 [Strongylocentrotus purpuratus]XP_030834757.1 uncharacterized protein LOC115921421 [Strongylocentrotus purpuratus]XP_030834763.1 uncharacterized protein LOC115921421 [Strongylocentrotus purpuratus]